MQLKMNSDLYKKQIEFINTDKRVGRKTSFSILFNFLKNNKMEKITIIETGTLRRHDKIFMDGGSTLVWGNWARLTNSDVYTCDISGQNIQNCKEITKEYNDVINYIVDDSVKFLKEFNGDIHLLYLDSFDSSAKDKEVMKQACEHQLNECKVVIEKLNKGCFVLLDDVTSNHVGGKAEKSIPYLLENGFDLIYENYTDNQVLFQKR